MIVFCPVLLVESLSIDKSFGAAGNGAFGLDKEVVDCVVPTFENRRGSPSSCLVATTLMKTSVSLPNCVALLSLELENTDAI